MNGTVKALVYLLIIDGRRWRDRKSDNFYLSLRLRRPNIRGHQARDTIGRRGEILNFPSGFLQIKAMLSAEETDVLDDDRAVGNTFPDEVMAHVNCVSVAVMDSIRQ